MSADYDYEGRITLTYVSEDGDQYQFNFDQPLTWPVALQKFVKFLGNIYGYDLTDRIGIKDNPYALERELWCGPTFDNDSSDVDEAAGLTD